jgi:heat shock protein HslJ
VTRQLLVLLSATILILPAAFAQDDNTPTLEGTSWQLVVIHSLADSEFEPASPEDYLLRFRSGNRLQIEAHCNQAGATWQINGNSLTLTDLVSTRKLCPSPSLFNRYLMNLQRAVSVTVAGERLVLHTDSDAERMVFEPYIFKPGVFKPGVSPPGC